ncbi:MAG: sensor histidine kinase [Flavobacteriia bacterium]|nr:sensor histidine kinase [Flavobacteriia bacterium]OIP46329.1 MAG: two-component sensor histidine kinase [Flavobacteriaceae bacterium CG2_30_31_66]PIV95697.1 MAG: two-component sensor histidine kinase [Flavobacteriaceae bacterium CG17_big_fil_post_rev_8_21_14_2_50_31_13]PIX14205.1 MAG: two-component sensor histidine kinase [Flavobacteriaceae bacterium CG_4_8_14_3_um_filter_31_8]PIY15595.1 MAG: two-component sensor histidine kinase [Flavobacteriaceae bacterium CG_4_10_14_3_um_filter_31_253]PI
MKLKKTYAYAFWSSFYLTLLVIIISIVSYFYLFGYFGNFTIIIAILTLFLISFFLIQYRAEHFIYRRLKKIYNEVSILDIKNLKKDSTITDIENISKSVQEFVEGKRLEIKSLTERDSFRRDFLGNVAHELKTPLFTVQGYILTLMEGAINDKQIRMKYLDRANKGVERLVAVIKDLDMIAKLENDGMKINVEVFNILELIQNVFDLFEMKAKKRNISLKFDHIYEFPVFVKADMEKIEQVLINLIVNSIKYGKPNGTTIVGVESYNEKKFIVKVIDNGEGIQKKHLSRLFERFYRVDQSRSREQGGSGLGLSIVKHILEAHDENILLKSTYGEGSEFSFTIEKAK